MATVAFLDLEVNPDSKKIIDIGAIKTNEEQFHQNSLPALTSFLSQTDYLCGHNFIRHDLHYLQPILKSLNFHPNCIIDTLFLSALLFPARPYHALNKNYKLQFESSNSPLNDAIITRDLLHSEIEIFLSLDLRLQAIFYWLLKDQIGFKAFFEYLNFVPVQDELFVLIYELFAEEICEQADLEGFIERNPVELAYTLSLIYVKNRYSITPKWLLFQYPKIESILSKLRSTPCRLGCAYCAQKLNPKIGLKKFFGYDNFRRYDDKPLQEQAAKAAIENKSLLAIFPTGGGKSITFQVPALMSGENNKGLTVVISPLQSLMKDQVDNLERNGITDAVTINGLLDPIERAKSLERVIDGSAALLYISPESLRSRTIERALLARNVVRFVIDEAHCFSSWGQDFRVDYLYIADFIKNLQETKQLAEPIAVSCFTATAKQRVVDDICAYFKTRLGLELEIFSAKVSRKNLRYQVFNKQGHDEKYQTLRQLIEDKNCPTIIYVSRTKRVKALVEQLGQDGFNVRGYHGKMHSQDKTANQEAFIAGDVQIMVATSAFGMGVDKRDVGAVIHYEISDSLENYVQEAGRAGRDENLQAECFVLFDEEDLSKHFILLNQTKISIKEIQQIWKAIKDMTRVRASLSNSALEIARKAGWDDTVDDIENRVTTAISALEDSGYVKRGQNMPRVFANSILCKNAQEAIEIIENSEKLIEVQKQKAIRIIKKLFSTKSRKLATDEAAESRVDYISDHLGIVRAEVIQIINIFREEKILADTQDLTAFIKKTETANKSFNILKDFIAIENALLTQIHADENHYSVKELNQTIDEMSIQQVTPNKIKTILNFWSIKNWVKKKNIEHQHHQIALLYQTEPAQLLEKVAKRHALAQFIVEYLYQRYQQDHLSALEKEECLIEFSIHELKAAYEKTEDVLTLKIDLDDVEDSLFYLSRIEAIKIEGGFMVIYNRLSLQRLEKNNLKKYTKEDYKKLELYYDNKVQQIHIVGEYAKKMVEDYQVALQFVEDYFQLNYSSFLRKYFPASKGDFLKQKMTASKFQRLFGELSPAQLKIINDSENQHIVVAAGPGSGKTRVLVHKLASLLMMEDVKHEQLLMLTFSRAAAYEFKSRLIQLIGNAAAYVEIKTFHSYCFDLLGKVGSLEQSDAIVQRATDKIKTGDVEINRISKMVLVIDEAQDMNAVQFELVQTLMEKNEEMRVIAVGDDDQTIYSFAPVFASAKHLQSLVEQHHAEQYELVENYRSKQNLVAFSNYFADGIQQRLKKFPIVAKQTDNGEIQLTRYSSHHLIQPLIEQVLATKTDGSRCILVQTNDEAAQITSLLLQRGIAAKLIQSNEGFNVFDLLEIRAFFHYLDLGEHDYIISAARWDDAIIKLKNRFQRSQKLDLCLNLIQIFAAIHPEQKYQSDFRVFVRESKLEDFYTIQDDIVFVSTIHKSKGREFDQVFLMLNQFKLKDDDTKRQLYVGLTRAKSHLNILCNTNILDGIQVENLILMKNQTNYAATSDFIFYLNHKNIYLNHFIHHASVVRDFVSGDILFADTDGCKNVEGSYVLKFSKSFKEQLQAKLKQGYHIKSAKVNFVVLWHKEDHADEYRIILPELHLIKTQSDY
ncbi:RecQ family ATP-dependent DNA helicase [Acinetobacter sp. MD2]|uniref:RecQ family ATP-dependent DNA helicase n=1 Tax=Acinetobacter sp. MD2 TaxID=2600066 RepID=UPI002D1F3F63|nr:RecQ family ATP-dependent DNA helicase [Acinetobacter sp. MD2]MEB3766502.1 RecQ family ATP-dependent DNA helicase [Acinetobacter sp. MD2]